MGDFKNGKGVTMDTKKPAVSFESREETGDSGEVLMRSFSGDLIRRTISGGSNLNFPNSVSPYTSGGRSPTRRNSWPDAGSEPSPPIADWHSKWDTGVSLPM